MINCSFVQVERLSGKELFDSVVLNPEALHNDFFTFAAACWHCHVNETFNPGNCSDLR